MRNYSKIKKETEIRIDFSPVFGSQFGEKSILISVSFLILE